jgi:hypothetical protein
LEARLAPTVSFSAPQTFAVGNNPDAVAIGDFNGDGRPDTAVVNSSDGTVSVFLNETPSGAGTVTFSAPQTFAVGLVPIAIVAVDLNGDGRPDLAIANEDDNTVSVLLNTTPSGASTLSFAAQKTFAVGSNPFVISLTAADLNSDGRPDLAVTINSNAGNIVAVLVNTTAVGASTPSFAQQQTFAIHGNPEQVVAADFNGDGRPDLAIAHFVDYPFDVLMNTTPAGASTLSFAAPQTFATEGNSGALAAVDLNGDGRPDLAVGDQSGTVLSVLMNSTPPGASTASFLPHQTFFSAGGGPGTLAVGDFDGDGRPDLAATGVTVFVNTTPAGASTASLAAPLTFTAASSWAVAVGDFNGDELPDLVTIDRSPNKMSVLLNTTVTAKPQSATVGQNTAKVITLTGVAPNNDPRTFAVTANPSHGTLSGLNSSTGAVTYTPAAGYTGPDSFQFTVNDTTTNTTSAAATVTIAVVPPPTANAQSVTAAQNTATAITLSGTPPNGDPLTFTVTTNPSHGTLSGLNASTGAVTYTPAAGYTGSDSFQFTVTDAASNLTSASATVSLTVAVPPTANAQSVTVLQGQAKAITLTGSAPNNDPLSFAVTANPSHGTLSGLNTTTGQVTYTPTGSYTGPDSFQFTVTDTATSLTSTATVGLTVAAPPTANAQSVTVGQSTAKFITLTGSAPNNDPLSFTVTVNPSHGTLSGLNATTGQVTYTPTGSYTGRDSFQFTVTDTTTTFTSAAATITVAVVPPPTANAQSATTGQDMAKNITLTGTTPNGDPLSFSVTANPAHGTLSGFNNNSGAVVYTPVAGYTGPDSFQFTVTDTASTLTSPAATVSVTVAPPPVANLQSVTALAGQPLAITLTGTAPNGHTLSFALASSPAHGSISSFNSSTGQLTYTSNPSYAGPDRFQFTVKDVTTGLSSAPATVSITVAPSPVVVAQFGATGVWRFNPSSGTWTHLTPSTASLLATDRVGDAVADFPGYGVWLYKASTGWKQIHSVDMSLLAMNATGVVAAQFPGYGVGEYVPGSGWRLLTGASASLLAIDAQGGIVGEFKGFGVWEIKPGNGWVQIHPVDVSLLAMDPAGDIAADFPGYGVGLYTPSAGWRLLNGTQATTLAMDGSGNVVANFAGAGVGEFFAGGGARLLTPAGAALLGADAFGEVFAEFSGYGVWQYDPAHGWVQKRVSDATLLAVA